MTILITGACGYIGSHITNELSLIGREVIVLDNLSAGYKEALLNNETLIKGDLLDKALLSEIFTQYKIDTVFHFAASISVEESVKDPFKYYVNNTECTLNLINECLKHKVNTFILSSTASVYGINSIGKPVTEEDSLNPINPYGRSKLMGEQLVRDCLLNTSTAFGILRYFNVCGASYQLNLGQRNLHSTHLISLCIEAALGIKDSVSIFGTNYPTKDGTAIRDYIDVNDLVDIHLRLLDYLQSERRSLILNAGYGHGYSVKEIIEKVKAVSNTDFRVIDRDRRPGDPDVLISDTTKLKNTLAWTPRFNNLDETILRAIKWKQKMHL